MKHKFLIVILLVLAVAIGAPFAYQGFTSGDADRTDDGRWFDCLNQKCRLFWSYSPLSPALSGEEQAFKDRLSGITIPPGKVTETELVQALGQGPTSADRSKIFSRLEWKSYGPGTDPERGVVIYIYHDQLKKVVWFMPRRFFLTKSYELAEDVRERIYLRK